MSRSNSRAISYSRSQISLGTSIASRQSINPNYHQIAIELVDGAPLDIVSQRDLRNVLIELTVLRSEANDIKDYVRSDNIKDIIMGLNKRIKPPPIRHAANVSPKNSPKGQTDTVFASNENSVNDNSNSPIRPKIALSKNEFSQISSDVDQMLEAMRNKRLKQVLANFNELDYPKYQLVISNRRQKCLNEFKYKDLKLLDTLSDKLRLAPYDPKNDIYNEKIEDLKARIGMSYAKIATLENEKDLKTESLTGKKNQEFQKLKEKHDKEMNDFDENNDILSQTVINRQSVALKEMRFNERLAAMTRDYEGAVKIHRNANIKEAEEKDENSRRFDENIVKRKAQLEKKQKAEIDCMEQRFDYLIEKDQEAINVEIDANMAAIKSAEIQISQYKAKIKQLSKSPK